MPRAELPIFFGRPQCDGRLARAADLARSAGAKSAACGGRAHPIGAIDLRERAITCN